VWSMRTAKILVCVYEYSKILLHVFSQILACVFVLGAGDILVCVCLYSCSCLRVCMGGGGGGGGERGVRPEPADGGLN